MRLLLTKWNLERDRERAKKSLDLHGNCNDSRREKVQKAQNPSSLVTHTAAAAKSILIVAVLILRMLL